MPACIWHTCRQRYLHLQIEFGRYPVYIFIAWISDFDHQGFNLCAVTRQSTASRISEAFRIDAGDIRIQESIDRIDELVFCARTSRIPFGEFIYT